MKHVLYLAWAYVRFNRVKSLVLTASICLIVLIPATVHLAVRGVAASLTSRAEATPLLLGAPGSATDLVLVSLYFRESSLAPTPASAVGDVAATGLGVGIPLHLRYQAGGARIVGTSPEYRGFRSLIVESGRWFALLGECVLGAETAARLGLSPGDSLLSSPAGAFDVAGGFPLKMKVVGVLAPAGTPDDEAIFVDVKTAWVIGGHAHGHQDVTQPEEIPGTPTRDAAHVVANASVLSYVEVTPDNVDSFHFHGDPGALPLDAVVIVPRDRKSGVLLRGRFEEVGTVQLVLPEDIVSSLVDTLFSVRDLLSLAALGLGAGTVATLALVFALSIRLRQREIETIRKIGGTRRRILEVLAAEVVLVLGAGILLAAGLTLLLTRTGSAAVRWFVGLG